MIGIYFSGTGNTKYCVEVFVKESNLLNTSYSIEDKEVIKAAKQADTIILGYPIYYSNLPKIVKDFIDDNKEIWKNKKVFIIATMGLFSGDGSGCGARQLKQYGAIILGGMHIRMPDSICDEKVLKNSLVKNRKIVDQAKDKICKTVKQIENDKYPKVGLGIFSQMIGFLGQRAWFNYKTKEYCHTLTINTSKCIGCHRCVTLCPMKNISMVENVAVASNRCTMCYRCINQCPEQAITLLGKEVIEQGSLEKYI